MLEFKIIKQEFKNYYNDLKYFNNDFFNNWLKCYVNSDYSNIFDSDFYIKNGCGYCRFLEFISTKHGGDLTNLKIDDYINKLKNGCKINIKPNKNDKITRNYENCIFSIENGVIYSKSKTLCYYKRDDLDINKLKKHFNNMILEGFIIEVLQWYI